jgi:hypothetical protein
MTDDRRSRGRAADKGNWMTVPSGVDHRREEVLRSAGRVEEAAAALEQALERYERKRNLVMAEQVQARLLELELRPSADPAERA